MADLYTYLSDQGIIIPNVSTIRATVESELKTVFGADLDFSPETVEGRLAELLTSERSAVLEVIAENASQINLDYATGVYLDAIGSRFSVDRIGVSSTRVLATVAGTAGTVIPANSVAKTTAGDEFYAENNITIPTGGTTTGYFLSSVEGAIPCEIGTLTKIITATSGWDSITNSAAATVGTDKESDSTYRARIKVSRATGNSFVESIKSGLEAVDNLTSSFAYDNGTSSPVVYDTVTIDAHSVIVVAEGGDNDDIALALFNRKSAGCGYTAINAASTIVLGGVGTDGHLISIGAQTYRLKSTMAAAYDVQIGGSAAATAASLSYAINANGTEGVDYYAGTAANTKATSTVVDDTLTVTSFTGVYGEDPLVYDEDATFTVDNYQVDQSITVSVTDPSYGAGYSVIFNRPEQIDVDVEITVKTGTYSGSDLEQAVKDAITALSTGDSAEVDGVTIGLDISPFEIAAAVSDAIPEISISLVEICVHGGTPATDVLTIHINQIAAFADANITVTIS